jgi:hypothetical protein
MTRQGIRLFYKSVEQPCIRNSVAFWQHKGGAEIGVAAIRGRNVLLILREALAKCPDQIPSPAMAEQAFITDDVLRDSIRLDISTATSSLQNGEWKAATVLAGAAAEALLLWAIKDQLASGATCGRLGGSEQNGARTHEP